MASRDYAWVSEADLLNVGEARIDQALLSNTLVTEYLGKVGKLGVVGGKGFGKTLLLKIKRHRMLVNGQSIFVLPQNKDLDVLQLNTYHRRKKIKFLGDPLVSKNRWPRTPEMLN